MGPTRCSVDPACSLRVCRWKTPVYWRDPESLPPRASISFKRSFKEVRDVPSDRASAPFGLARASASAFPCLLFAYAHIYHMYKPIYTCIICICLHTHVFLCVCIHMCFYVYVLPCLLCAYVHVRSSAAYVRIRSIVSYTVIICTQYNMYVCVHVCMRCNVEHNMWMCSL
jgi:hypothetical protein